MRTRICPSCYSYETLAVLNDIVDDSYFAGCACRDCGAIWDEVIDDTGTCHVSNIRFIAEAEGDVDNE